MNEQPSKSVARLSGVSLRYGKTLALDALTLDFPAGRMIGLIGPVASAAHPHYHAFAG